ncbi:MAG TPA: 3-phosphoshikimate 1-carboxyvinyltransferase [Candidatus Dormibacteraeota bacterium]|nr:3-phosphoshikimate 1-carboxyvinyltransferase [Candidatus Dormibacteraeota bacterium]
MAEPPSAVRVSRAPRDEPTHVRWSPVGDKSITQRALFLAALARGRSVVEGFLWSQDTMHCMTALRQLGVGIELDAGGRAVIDGVGRHGLGQTGSTVYLGNSATSSRIMLALLAGQTHYYVLDGNEALRRRPMGWVVEPLREMGARLSWLVAPGGFPVAVAPAPGGLAARRLDVRVDSAQAVSALLFAGLVAEGRTVIRRRTRARDHTERLLRFFDVRVDETDSEVAIEPPRELTARRVAVAGDISASALVIAAAVLDERPGLTVTVDGVGMNDTRTGFLEALRAMGADLRIEVTGTVSGEPVGQVTVASGRRLHGVRVDGPRFVQSTIDELPLLAAVAATADGPTVVADAAELRDKDTDRIATTAALLSAFGVRVDPAPDGFTVHPPPPGGLRAPARVGAQGDHRVAFAAMALASRLDEPTVITDWDVVEISFPDCLTPLSRLARVQELSRARRMPDLAAWPSLRGGVDRG